MLVTASSFKNIPIPKDMVIIGEVGLTGEVRRINLIEKRLVDFFISQQPLIYFLN